MLWAIIWDVVWSLYEWSWYRDKDSFELFKPWCTFTDDTILTTAIAKSIIKWTDWYNDELKSFALKYPNIGFGDKFFMWVEWKIKKWTSRWNWAPMRISPIWLYFNDLQSIKDEVIKAVSGSHNTIEAIEWAYCIASIIYLLKTWKDKKYIKQYVLDNFEYYLPEDVYFLQNNNKFFDMSAKGTVPYAITCFLDSNSFEDCIRNCISIWWDTDTIACMAWWIAEQFYWIPEEIKNEVMNYLDDNIKNIISEFYSL